MSGGIHNGSPAFPRAASSWNSGEMGMTLRDYFAAHAPADPQEWFEPVMPSPKPEAKYDHDHFNSEQCVMREFDCAPMNCAEREAWQEDYRRQYVIQWPYAWATAMLAERAKVQP